MSSLLSRQPAAGRARDPLGEALERQVAASERHVRGQYFTPDPVIDLVLGMLDPDPGSVVLDPACGSGRFLLAAQALWPLDSADLRGFETDPPALQAAREQLPGASISGCDFLRSEALADVDLVIGNPPYIRNRGHKRDLYVDFIESSVAHLRPGGRIALVLSNAWLDVGYGRELRQYLLDHCALEWLVESTAERWFPGARINTMLLIARRCPDPDLRAAQQVSFARVEQPLPAEPRVLRRITQDELAADSCWGPLLRAPELYLALRRGKTPVPLVPLGDLVELRRGFTTNDNAFFYPPPAAGIEAEYLQPLLKSPKRVAGVRGRAAELPDRVFLCDRSRQQLQQRGHSGALAWIDRHRAGAGPASWSLPQQRPSRLFVVKGVADRFRQPLFDVPVYADQQLYSALPTSTVCSEAALAALLNSSWCKLSMEMAGRVNFGDGVLWLALGDVRTKLWVPDLRLVSSSVLQSLEDAFDALPGSAVQGLASAPAGNPDAVRWQAAQERLDSEVAALLGLDSAQQQELREVLRERCCCRVRMAVRRG